MSDRIYLSAPDVTDAERTALLAAFDSGWIAPLGPQVDSFEAKIAARAGRPAAAGLSSGTAALHLALRLVGAQRDDVVLVQDLTFIATANAARYEGCEVAFVDVEESTWGMDPKALEEALEHYRKQGRRVAAVIPVDLYGSCPRYEALEPICERYGVPLIEDAAEALGSSRAGRPAGSFGAIAAFSFNGNKIITTSGGGALVGDDDLVARARWLAAQAREPVTHYEHREVGFNYRLSNLLAGLGVAQLERLDTMIARRRAIHARYVAELSLRGWNPFESDEDNEMNQWLTVFRVAADAPLGRDEALARLAAANIEGRPVWKPMSQQPVFENARCFGQQTAARLFATGICLPSGSAMTDDEQTRVIQALTTANNA